MTPFPPDSAEHLAQSPLDAADGDYAAAVERVSDAARVLMRWHFHAVFCESGGAHNG